MRKELGREEKFQMIDIIGDGASVIPNMFDGIFIMGVIVLLSPVWIPLYIIGWIKRRIE